MIFKQLINPYINGLRMYSTKLAYISDLHLEHNKWNEFYPKIDSKQSDIIKRAHGLAIIGDLGNPTYDNFSGFLRYIANYFNNIYFISGNHEYYTKNTYFFDLKNVIDERINNSIEKAKVSSGNQNIYYLNDEAIDIGDNKFIIGSTLWSDHKLSIIDRPDNMFYKFVNEQHSNSVRFLENELLNIHTINTLFNVNIPNVTI